MSDFADNLDWNLLHTFLIVCQERSMTRAAEVLHRTQPAVSLAIKRLEQATGEILIERRKAGLTPTSAGEMLLGQARAIYTTVSRMPAALDLAPKAISGKVTIWSIDTVVSLHLDSTIQAFFAQHRRVDLEVQISTTDNIIRAVELGSATIGISDGIIPKALRSDELLTESFGLYCGYSHRLARRDDVNLGDLRDEPFIAFTADILGGQHMGAVTAFRAQASIGQNVRGRSSSVHEVKRMIQCGLGIGLLPRHLAEPDVDRGLLWRLPPYRDEPAAPIFVISNPTIRLTQAEELFMEAMRRPFDSKPGEPA